MFILTKRIYHGSDFESIASEEQISMINSAMTILRLDGFESLFEHEGRVGGSCRNYRDDLGFRVELIYHKDNPDVSYLFIDSADPKIGPTGVILQAVFSPEGNYVEFYNDEHNFGLALKLHAMTLRSYFKE